MTPTDNDFLSEKIPDSGKSCFHYHRKELPIYANIYSMPESPELKNSSRD
jgi:hypothetical protein